MREYIITKKNGSVPFSGVYTGDLPIGSKTVFSEKTGWFEHVYSDKNILSFNKNSFLTFQSYDEAQDYIDSCSKRIEENRSRYDDVVAGSTDKLLETIGSLRIKEINQG